MGETIEKATAPIDGYKSYAGAAIIAIGQIASSMGRPDVGGALEILGQFVLSIGIAHKFAKAS